MHRWTLLIAAHATAATLAVMLGLVVLRTPRKGDAVHRRLGTVWFAAMYFTALSSFGIKQLRPGHFSWIHGLSAWTLVSLTIALWAARAGRRQLHQAWVVGSYFGLLGAGLAAMAFPVRLAPQLLLHRPLVFAAGLIVIALATWAIVRVVRRTATAGDRAAPAELRGYASSAAPSARSTADRRDRVRIGGAVAVRAAEPAGTRAVGAAGGVGGSVAVHERRREPGA